MLSYKGVVPSSNDTARKKPSVSRSNSALTAAGSGWLATWTPRATALRTGWWGTSRWWCRRVAKQFGTDGAIVRFRARVLAGRLWPFSDHRVGRERLDRRRSQFDPLRSVVVWEADARRSADRLCAVTRRQANASPRPPAFAPASCGEPCWT